MRIILVFLVMTFYVSVTFSQNSTLSLETIIERALANSYRVEVKEQNVNAVRNMFQYDRSQTLPQFSSELAREQRYLRPYNFRQQWALLHSEWSLGDFLLKSDRAAQQDILMANAVKEQTRLDVTQRVAFLYLSTLQKETNTNLLQQRLQLLQTHHDVAEALWQAGTRTELDVLQTESEISQLREQITLLNIDKDNLLQEMWRLIDWSSGNTIQITPLNTAAICVQPAPQFAEEDLQANPILQSLDFQIKAQHFRIKSMRAQQIPRLSISGGYMEDTDPTGDGNYWQIDAGITLPIFRWGATKFQQQKSQAILLAIESQRKETKRELMIRITQALDRLRQLKNVLSLQNNRLELNKNAFQLAEANYQAGLITNLEYLSAQQKLSETQIDIQETQLKYIMNLIDYYIVTNQVEKIKNMAVL